MLPAGSPTHPEEPLYLGLNFTGLGREATALEVLKRHTRDFADVIGDVLPLEQKLLEKPANDSTPPSVLSPAELKWELEAAILADPTHGVSGRSAPRRLERTLALARRHGLDLKVLEELASRHL